MHAALFAVSAIPKLRGGVALVIVLLVMTGLGRPARAETLEQALADAYLINPVLNAERARVRASGRAGRGRQIGPAPFYFGDRRLRLPEHGQRRLASSRDHRGR